MTSLRDIFIQDFDHSIKKFLDVIAEKFTLDSQELFSLWTSNSAHFFESKSKKSIPSTSKSVISDSQKNDSKSELINMNDLSPDRLYKANKNELSALCKSRAIKSTGKKEELIERLLEIFKKNSDSKSEIKSDIKSDTKSDTKSDKKISSRDFRTSKKSESNIIQKISNNVDNIVIRRSVHNNYIHPLTKLVFDQKTKNVIGKEEDDGTISELNEEDIESCKKYKFSFEMPSNLDKSTNLDNVEVEELDEILKKEKEENNSIEEIEEEEEEEEEEIEVEDD